MKSKRRIASELGVTTQEIENRLNAEFTERFHEHIENKDGCVYFDAEVEEFLRLLFNKTEEPNKYIGEWYEEAFGGLANPVTNSAEEAGEEARQEAALSKSTLQLPVPQYAPIPVVRAITMPLNYHPDILAQAVDAQRHELFEYLNQLDQLVDYFAPDEWQSRRWRTPGQKARKPIRLIGTSV